MLFLRWIAVLLAAFAAGKLLRRSLGKIGTVAVLIVGITVTAAVGFVLNKTVFTGISLKYMLMGVAFSAVFSNMVSEERLKETVGLFRPILAVSLSAVFAAKKGFELAGEIKAR